MPFDSAEFFREAAVPRPPPPAWHARLAAALARAFQHPWRPKKTVTIDAAVLRVLEEARGLIEQREDWIKGAYQTFGGERCAVGALRIATGLLHYPAAGRMAHEMLTLVAIRRGYGSIEAMNDASRHEHVLAAFDDAIASVRHPAEF